TPEERRYAISSKAQMIARLAKRFAAKEACAKALGTGIGQGVAWREIGVVRGQFGPPTLELTGAALKRLQKLVPQGMVPHIHISLTDDRPQALAFVVISAIRAT
ncbi:MAG: holo-ACP synthase, partial [Pseudomonadota bacterium]